MKIPECPEIKPGTCQSPTANNLGSNIAATPQKTHRDVSQSFLEYSGSFPGRPGFNGIYMQLSVSVSDLLHFNKTGS